MCVRLFMRTGVYGVLGPNADESPCMSNQQAQKQDGQGEGQRSHTTRARTKRTMRLCQVMSKALKREFGNRHAGSAVENKGVSNIG